MNPIQQAILDRRSIRAYSAAPLTVQQIQHLVDAALASPSANNSQPWHFSIVQDQALLDRVHAAAKAEALRRGNASPRYADPDFQVFYRAPLVIFLSSAGADSLPFSDIDIGIAAENIVLSAQGMGLGSVVLGLPRTAFMGPEADELRAALKFPQGYDFRICVAIGTRATTKEAHPIGENKLSYVD